MTDWRTACGKAMIPEERRWLRDTAAEIEAEFGDAVIVNIGIFRGASLYCLRAGAMWADLYGIDIEYPQGVEIVPVARVEIIIADSSKCHTEFGHPIHFLFIDGDHSYEGVKADIEGWTPKIVSGGIVAFHDFAPEPEAAAAHAGVKKAILEWEARERWEIIPAPGSIRAYRRPE